MPQQKKPKPKKATASIHDRIAAGELKVGSSKPRPSAAPAASVAAQKNSPKPTTAENDHAVVRPANEEPAPEASAGAQLEQKAEQPKRPAINVPRVVQVPEFKVIKTEKPQEEKADEAESAEQSSANGDQNQEGTQVEPEEKSEQGFGFLDVDEGEDSRGDSEEAPEGSSEKSTPFYKRKWPWIVLASVAAVIVVVMGLYSWQHWLAHDDGADFVGAWNDSTTGVVVTIDDKEIRLTSEVAYEYTLDTAAKTITYKFHDLSGKGYYRFSLDRQRLAIVEGSASIGDTFWSDFGFTVQSLWNSINQRQTALPSGEGVTSLVRSAVQPEPATPETAAATDEEAQPAAEAQGE